jgi:glutathione peroxidase
MHWTRRFFKTPGMGHDAIAQSLSDFQVTSVAGDAMPMAEFEGKVVLVVNVASQCGLTPQYTGLEALYQQYKDRGLVIVGCPCNQFGAQEPGTEDEIVLFCSRNYDVTFPLTAKLEVNGSGAHPMWEWMKRAQPGMLGSEAIKWNFTKFLVGRDGKVLERFSPTDEPSKLSPIIERALG